MIWRRDRWRPSLKVHVLRTKPPLRGPTPADRTLVGMETMEAGQVAPRLPKCRGKLLQEAFPVTQVTLGMTQGALPLSPRDTQPLDHVGGPWHSHCRGAPNMEPGLLGGSPPPAPCTPQHWGRSARLLCPLGGPVTSPALSRLCFFLSFSSIKWRQKGQLSHRPEIVHLKHLVYVLCLAYIY